MTDLSNDDIELINIDSTDSEHFYVFTFVGVITVAGCILKCYPKYILNSNSPKNELKQILKVIEKQNTKKQFIKLFNDNSEGTSFNLLAVMLFLLQDYYEYGSYTNTQVVIEKNGSGEIMWDKTINETFTFLSNNRPYYPELLTKKIFLMKVIILKDFMNVY